MLNLPTAKAGGFGAEFEGLSSSRHYRGSDVVTTSGIFPRLPTPL
jgi:hypothetical protein